MRCFALYGRFLLSQCGKVVPGSAIAKCIAKPCRYHADYAAVVFRPFLQSVCRLLRA